MGPTGSPKLSVPNHLTPRDNPEDGRIQFNGGRYIITVITNISSTVLCSGSTATSTHWPLYSSGPFRLLRYKHCTSIYVHRVSIMSVTHHILVLNTYIQPIRDNTDLVFTSRIFRAAQPGNTDNVNSSSFPFHFRIKEFLSVATTSSYALQTNSIFCLAQKCHILSNAIARCNNHFRSVLEWLQAVEC